MSDNRVAPHFAGESNDNRRVNATTQTNTQNVVNAYENFPSNFKSDSICTSNKPVVTKTSTSSIATGSGVIRL